MLREVSVGISLSDALGLDVSKAKLTLMQHLQDEKICIVADRDGMIYFIDVGSVRKFCIADLQENAYD